MPDIPKFEPIVAAKLTAMGYELYELKFIRAGTRSVLRIFVDGPSGVKLSDCERISHELAVLLEVENFSEAPYTLEVSSPGLDRPLINERDFRRVVGQTVTVRLRDEEGQPKSRSARGVIVSSIEGVLTLDTAAGEKAIPLSGVLSGKIEFKF